MRMVRTWMIFAIFVFMSLGASAQAQQFRAGAATSNITPFLGTSINGSMSDIRAAHVHDELHARCLVLDDGKTKLAFAICDSCMIPKSVVDEAKAQIARVTSISADHVLISATQAHSAACADGVFQSEPDPSYPPFLARRIADGVARAVNQLEPARIGWATADVPEHLHNRRWRMKPGTVPANPFGETGGTVQMNPPPGSPNLVEPAGPVDPQVSLLWVEAPGARELALLANYGLHYVGGVGAGHISADYYGAFARELAQLLDAEDQQPPFVAMMSNGTSGDVNNIRFESAEPPLGPYEKIELVATDLALNTATAKAKVLANDTARLSARAALLELGVRKPTAEEVSRAEQILAAAGGINTSLKTLEQIYARETVLLAKYPDTVPVVIQALRVGDVGIVAIPCEVFAEIGLEIKAKSPFKPTFVIELANGYNGYLPTKAQHALGGYETWRARSSYLAVDASEKIVAQALELLRQLRAEP